MHALFFAFLMSSASIVSPIDISPRPEDADAMHLAFDARVTAAIALPSAFDAEAHEETTPEIAPSHEPAQADTVKRTVIKSRDGVRHYVYETSAASSLELAYPSGR